jgi:hypothetical protein
MSARQYDCTGADHAGFADVAATKHDGARRDVGTVTDAAVVFDNRTRVDDNRIAKMRGRLNGGPRQNNATLADRGALTDHGAVMND